MPSRRLSGFNGVWGALLCGALKAVGCGRQRLQSAIGASPLGGCLWCLYYHWIQVIQVETFPSSSSPPVRERLMIYVIWQVMVRVV